MTTHEDPAAESVWVSSRKAERLVGLSRTTLWRIAKSRDGVKTARVGGSLRFHRGSLLEYMERHATQPKLPGFDDL